MNFEQQNIPVDRVYSLTRLVSACEKNNVGLENVVFFQNGFQVLFEDMPGDAVLHDYSYGNKACMWETIGFPWDCSDVSVHEAETLAKMLGALKTGNDWKLFEEE